MSADESDENSSASAYSSYMRMFTDKERATLETDVHDVGVKEYIYHNTPQCTEHHAQLLEALQIGEVDDEDALFRSKLNKTFTSAGRHTLRKWLEHPLTDANDIELRASLRKAITGEDETKKISPSKTRHVLASMEESWRSLKWCWSEDQSKKELTKQILFGDMFARLNDIPLAQNAYHHFRIVGTPLIQILTPLIPVVMSFLMLRWMGAGMSFHECWQMSSGIFKNSFWLDQTGGGGGSLMKVMGAIKWLWWIIFLGNIVLMLYQSYRHYTLLSHVYRRVYRAAKWVENANTLVRDCLPGTTNHPKLDQNVASIIAWVNDAHPTFGVFTNAYGFLNTYQRLREVSTKGTCEGWVRHVGVLDAVHSIDSLLKHSDFTVPRILDQENHARVDIQKAYHPLLDSNSQTSHDILLDRHVVLTGSNASGKSTVLKTLLLNVLLAQSWGISSSKQMQWVPFSSIRGYLHTVDDCGRESLFQAQIRRIEEFILEARARNAKTDTPDRTCGPSLLVVDEILNSTNPIEAMLLSYQYARIIGDELGDRSRMVMTTHYPVLTTLATKYPKQFANWAMGDGYQIKCDEACHASSAIGTVKAMTSVLDDKAHRRLERAYRRMYKRLQNMKFKDLDKDHERTSDKKKVTSDEKVFVALEAK